MVISEAVSSAMISMLYSLASESCWKRRTAKVERNDAAAVFFQFRDQVGYTQLTFLLDAKTVHEND